MDRAYREPAKSWWSAEAIAESDIVALGTDHAAVLLSHEAPSSLPAIDTRLVGSVFPIEDVVYAETVRAMLTKGFMAVRPGLVFHGHHHVFHDSTKTFGVGENTFESRVIGLDRDLPKRPSLAVLDVKNNGIRFYTSAGKPAGE